jgi:hypothetical protein
MMAHRRGARERGRVDADRATEADHGDGTTADHRSVLTWTRSCRAASVIESSSGVCDGRRGPFIGRPSTGCRPAVRERSATQQPTSSSACQPTSVPSRYPTVRPPRVSGRAEGCNRVASLKCARQNDSQMNRARRWSAALGCGLELTSEAPGAAEGPAPQKRVAAPSTGTREGSPAGRAGCLHRGDGPPSGRPTPRARLGEPTHPPA